MHIHACVALAYRVHMPVLVDAGPLAVTVVAGIAITGMIEREPRDM